ncbi:MAG TPA: ABC transporter ATP-binding protein [Burkholderiaceae bacterium]|nr:ABC transporter ATP-binding protein [Burkholderiaceae bacterium]
MTALPAAEERTSMPQREPLLVLDGLRKHFGGSQQPIEAIASVSLEIGRGEFVSVVGPSGCGKSTLLQIVAGLADASAGSVALDGAAVDGPRDGMVYLFQQYARSLFPWMTVEQNVRFAIEHRHGASRSALAHRCLRYLTMVGLDDFRSRYPWELSGGMQQRVAIARALAAEPQVLLLDEPFSSVDALTRLDLQNLILRIWEQTGVTVVLVTHDVDEAVYLSDRIALLTRRPATVAGVFENRLPRPRHPVASREEPSFLSLRHELLERLLSS